MPTYYPPQGMPQAMPNAQAGQNDILASILEDAERRKQEYQKKRLALLQAKEEAAQAKHAKNLAKINAITGAIGAVGSIGGQIFNKMRADNFLEYVDSEDSEVSAPPTDATQLVPEPGDEENLPQLMPLPKSSERGGKLRKFNLK